MTEEIKEILNVLNRMAKENKESDNPLQATVILFEILYIVLDYITNLQEELQKANDTIKELRDNKALELLKISINSQYINTQNENIRLNNIIYREISDYILKKYGMLDNTHYHDFLNELELKESDEK